MISPGPWQGSLWAAAPSFKDTAVEMPLTTRICRNLPFFTQAVFIIQDSCPTLFLFDEPTTGSHFDDVRVLLKVFQRLVDAGHSVVIIEHNLDVIKSADWLIDLGPGAGDEGGEIAAAGVSEAVADCERSHTGSVLRLALPKLEASNGRL